MRPIATPKYKSIAEDLRQRIIDGTLEPGVRMPTLAELMERYGVSERTVFQATQLLLRESLITSKPGAGYHVRERPEIQRMVRSWYREPRGGSPWCADMAAQGREGSWVAESRPQAAAPAIAERLRIEPAAKVMRTEYLFTADGVPTYLSTSWEPLAITSGTEIMLPEDGEHAGRGVIDRFAQIGIEITRGREEITSRGLTEAEADRIGLNAGISVVVIERTYFAGDKPIETADIVLPPHLRAVYDIPVGDTP